MPTTYGWQSKRYLFGSARGAAGNQAVAAAVQEGLPSRLLGTASYFIGTAAGKGTVTVTSTTLTFSQSQDGVVDVNTRVTVGDNTYKVTVKTSNTVYQIAGGVSATDQMFAYSNDRVRLIAKIGDATPGAPSTSEIVLLDDGAIGTPVNRLNEELQLSNFVGSLPGLTGYDNWYLSFRTEIITDFLDPTPESPDWPFVENQEVVLYLYRDLLTQSFTMRSEPIDTNLTRAGVRRTTVAPEYLPLSNVQTVFYFANTGSTRLRAATVVSDRAGRIRVPLPAGSYDIVFYGGGILESEWIQNYPVGAGTTLTPWRGNSTTGVAQAAEYNVVRAQFSTLYWPGYMVAEDFSPERAAYRDESAETNSYGNDYAIQLFGRVFAGQSWIDFVGMAIDPSPE